MSAYLLQWMRLSFVRSMAAEGVSFVYGPPGTGKSQTIAAISQCTVKERQFFLLQKMAALSGSETIGIFRNW
ncbi:MAG: hypothetical protein ACLVI9_09560 [Anaerostipes hadrus]